MGGCISLNITVFQDHRPPVKLNIVAARLIYECQHFLPYLLQKHFLKETYTTIQWTPTTYFISLSFSPKLSTFLRYISFSLCCLDFASYVWSNTHTETHMHTCSIAWCVLSLLCGIIQCMSMCILLSLTLWKVRHLGCFNFFLLQTIKSFLCVPLNL